MEIAEALDVIEEMAEGLRISIEAESAVVSALEAHQGAWDAARSAGSVPVALTRRIRQLQESKGHIRRWQRELGAYEAAIRAARPTAPATGEGSE